MKQEVPVIQWSAYEYEYNERESDWFWALGIAAVSMAIIAILFNDGFFAILIIVAAITLGLLARKPPEFVTFSFSESGLSIDDTFHKYKEIVAFYVDEEHHSGRAHLLLETEKFMAPSIIIPLTDEVDPDELRKHLLKRIKEKPMQEPFTHRVVEFLGL